MLNRSRHGDRQRGDLAFAVGLVLLLGLLVGVLMAMERGDTTRLTLEPVPAAISGEAQEGAAARLRFDLPETSAGQSPWVIWLPRFAARDVWLTGHGWKSPRLGFFDPSPADGVLAGGYRFELPPKWEGPLQITLHSSARLPASLQPQLVRADEAARLEQSAAVAAAAVYASLLMLALLALALHAAARDRAFLTLFAASATALLMLAATSGHLYSIPGLRMFGAWGGQGVWALLLVFLAAWLRLFEQYAGAHRLGAGATRAIEIAFWILLGLAGVCLLGLGFMMPLVQFAANLAWVLVGLGTLALLIDAGLRKVRMAWPLAGLILLVLAAAALLRLTGLGEQPGPLLTRLLFQGGLVFTLAVCAIGLVHRISEYREQRDRDRLARADTERRMLREAARTDLVHSLQSKLRQVDQGDVAVTAFRVMVDHLSPLLPADMIALVSQGYQDHPNLMIDPDAARAELAAEVQARTLTLRRQVGNGIAFQQPVSSAGGTSIEAVIPLKLRAPAWGVLLIRREGSHGFGADEMALAAEFCRLAQLQVEQVIAAIKLRKSAELDALTGSLNRRSIDQWLVRSFAEADRDDLPLSVLFVDLDRFKGINDRYGHAGGDQCLRAVAATLSGALDEGDLFGRYGGEEFIAILPGRGGAAAREVGERLRAAVERQEVECEGQALKLTVSVGVATRRDGEGTPAATIERADKALYAAKRAGRNCVHVAPAVFT